MIQEESGPAELERYVTVVTPESTALLLPLAGLGSRFAAALVDLACQALALVVLGAAVVLPVRLGGAEPAAWAARHVLPLALVAGWLVVWGYYVLFETAWSGQTPGKRALRLRVVAEGGYGLGFTEAALRNMVRFVDLLPIVTPYLAGGLSVWLTPRRQRLGDVVAGTLVVRERATPWIEALLAGEAETEPAESALSAAQVDRLTAADVALIARFLERSDGLPLATRRELAARLAEPLRERLGASREGPGSDADEWWLAGLHRSWTRRHRRW